MSKDFWNLPVNPVWRVPSFMKEGKADNEHSNPVLLPLVPQFTNICILIYSCYTFKKILLEVVAIGRKNARWESDKDSDMNIIAIATSPPPLQPLGHPSYVPWDFL